MNTKPFITVLFMCATSFGAFSQFYADAFDRQYLTSDPTGNGTSILSGRYTSSVDYELEIGNGQGTYQTLTGPILQALLLMYKATDDISYLNQFTINSKHVQDHRDDKMQGSNSGPSFPVFDPDDASVIYDYWNAGVSNPRPMAPTWSIFMPVGEHLKWYASAVYSGEILFPMAQFVRLIQVENPSLASVACPVSGFATMGSYANWLETQIWLTIDAHSDAGFDQVNTNATRDIYKYFGLSWGFYKGISSGTPVEHNFATSMGRVFVTLFDCSTSGAVKNRLRGYLEVLKSNWILKAELEAYGWDGYNWSHKQNGTGGDEEVSHGAYAMHMALLCYQYGIMDSYGFPIYPEPMIRKLVNTFVRNMYNAP